MTEPLKSKIPAVRIASDDCAVHVGRRIVDGEITDSGTAHLVHVGEWVEIVPYITIGEAMMAANLVKPGDTPQTQADRLRQLSTWIAGRVVAWSWSDIYSRPLPQPFGRPEIIEGLADDEFAWLLGALQSGEGRAGRKNDSRPLPSTLSAAARPRPKRS